MNLEPLLAAPVIVQAHGAAAVAALALGSVLLSGPKGVRRHRRLGWLWAGLMAFVALSSLWISGEQMRFGPFSWIHGLAVFSLVMLPLGLWRAHTHRVTAHRRTMLGLYVGALVIAGLFTLAPGRIIGRALWGAG